MPSPGSKLRSLFHRSQKYEKEESTSVPSSPTQRQTPTQSQQSPRLSSTQTRQNGSLNGVPYESTAPGSAPRQGQKPLAGEGPASRETSRIRQASTDARSRSRPAGARASVDSRRADPRLPQVQHQSDLSSDLPQQHFSRAELDSSARKNSDVIDRAPNGSSKPLSLRHGRYSEDVADWNNLKADRPQSSSDVPAPLNVGRGPAPTGMSNAAPGISSRSGDYPSPATDGTRRSSMSRRGVGAAPSIPRSSLESGYGDQRGSAGLPVRTKGASMEKSLPVAPQQPPPPAISQPSAPAVPQHQQHQQRASLDNSIPNVDMAESKVVPDQRLAVKDAARPPTLKGVVDLSTTEDTTVHENWAAPVTQETVHRKIHHIREEVVTREIHNHHIFHRVLPVIDIEVLPARHFVPVEGGNYIEISADEVPGRVGNNQGWIIAETVSKLPTKAAAPTGPRQFTARRFEGDDGDYREYVGKDGIKRTETTWVHPPTLETAGMWTGQTMPFHFGAANLAENGLHATLPVGQVIGSSPLLAQQKRADMRSLHHKSSSRDLRAETEAASVTQSQQSGGMSLKAPDVGPKFSFDPQQETLPTPPHTANRSSFMTGEAIGRAI